MNDFKVGQFISKGNEYYLITGESETGKPMITIKVFGKEKDIRIDNYEDFNITSEEPTI